jgi:ABC-type amino acid transport substrate-binding protein
MRLWLVLLLGIAHADVSQIKQRSHLVVSLKKHGDPDPRRHQDPLHFQKRSFELELASAIARRFGDGRLEIRELRGVERLPALVEGQVDLVIAMVAIPDLPSKEIVYSQPYYAGDDEDRGAPAHRRARFAVAVRRSDPELLRVVDEVIAGLKRSGELARWIARFQLPAAPEVR